jgi:hypothetical protein
MGDPEIWPPLPLIEWQDTCRTLQMWTQIVGKIRMELFPPLNHWWNVTLYVNSRGLTSGPIQYPWGVFEIQFDFQKHQLSVFTSEGSEISRPLRAESVAFFYESLMRSLAALGISVSINLKPQEVPGAVPFDQDYANCSYDADCANRFWRILVSVSQVFERFRAEFIGKCSPVHFFWGSFDLACTRFFGKARATSQGRDQWSRVFARGLQRGLLAGRRRGDRCGVFTPMPCRCQRGWRKSRCGRPPRAGIRSFRNSF